MTRPRLSADMREEIMRERIFHEPVDGAYFMAARIIEELEDYFRCLEPELLAMGDTARCRSTDNEWIGSETGIPDLAWQHLEALARVAGALDASCAGVLSAFAIKSKAVMVDRLLTEEWADVSWMAEGMAGLAKDCGNMLAILDRKIRTMALTGNSGAASRQQAISKIRMLYGKIGSVLSPRDAMQFLVEADDVAASQLKQTDWAELLNVTARTISKYPAWQQLREFKRSTRMSLKSPRSLADYDLTSDDGGDDE